MRIVKQASHGETVSYSLNFGIVWKGRLSVRLGFECNEAGKVYPLTNDAALANYERAMAGLDGLISMGIERYVHSYRIDAIGQCDYCKRHIVLSSFTNTCDCGADYNSFGQLLADRSQWGEETGETASDILSGTFEY